VAEAENQLWTQDEIDSHQSDLEPIGRYEKSFKLVGCPYPASSFPAKLVSRWDDKQLLPSKISEYISKKLTSV
jgi:hypothetical protein